MAEKPLMLGFGRSSSGRNCASLASAGPARLCCCDDGYASVGRYGSRKGSGESSSKSRNTTMVTEQLRRVLHRSSRTAMQAERDEEGLLRKSCGGWRRFGAQQHHDSA